MRCRSETRAQRSVDTGAQPAPGKGVVAADVMPPPALVPHRPPRAACLPTKRSLFGILEHQETSISIIWQRHCVHSFCM